MQYKCSCYIIKPGPWVLLKVSTFSVYKMLLEEAPLSCRSLECKIGATMLLVVFMVAIIALSWWRYSNFH